MTRATPGYSNGGGEKGAESGCNFTVEPIGFPPEKKLDRKCETGKGVKGSPPTLNNQKDGLAIN